jgi:DNA primase
LNVDDLKNHIKDTPISQIIGHYIDLKRSGQHQSALCPFHDDKNPSLMINDQKNLFRCFACQTGGDAISFVEKFQKIDFMAAMKEIATILGVELDSPKAQPINPRLEMARKLMSKAVALYLRARGSEFYSFLNERKIREDIAETYQVGQANDTNLIGHYLSSLPDENVKAMAIEVALEIGLLKEVEHTYNTFLWRDMNLRDTFKSRIMFPIKDQFGHVIGFSGRLYANHQGPKYLNSKESFLFNKKNILFGLQLAKKFIQERETVILVEGHMDQLALYQAGFEHSVAIMGTAFNPMVIELLKKWTSRFILAFDSDHAGLQAMKRAHPFFLQQKILPLYLQFAPYKDPDEFLIERGALDLQKRIDLLRPLLETLMSELLGEKVPDNTEAKIGLLEQFFQIVAPLGKDLRAMEYIGQFAQRLGLKSASDQIAETYQQFLEKRPMTFPSHEVIPEEFVAASAPVLPEILEYKQFDHLSQLLIQEVLTYPDLLTHPKLHDLLDELRQGWVKEFAHELKIIVCDSDESQFEHEVLALLKRYHVSEEWLKHSQIFAQRSRWFVQAGTQKDLMITDLYLKIYTDTIRSFRDKLKVLQKECFSQSESDKILRKMGEIDHILLDIRKYKQKWRNEKTEQRFATLSGIKLKISELINKNNEENTHVNFPELPAI